MEDGQREMLGADPCGDGRPDDVGPASVCGYFAGAGRLVESHELAVNDGSVVRFQRQHVYANEACWQDSSLRADEGRAKACRSGHVIACAAAVTAKVGEP